MQACFFSAFQEWSWRQLTAVTQINGQVVALVAWQRLRGAAQAGLRYSYTTSLQPPREERNIKNTIFSCRVIL